MPIRNGGRPQPANEPCRCCNRNDIKTQAVGSACQGEGYLFSVCARCAQHLAEHLGRIAD